MAGRTHGGAGLPGSRAGRGADLGYSVAAVVFRWELTAVRDNRSSAAPLGRRVAALCGVGVHIAIIADCPPGQVDARLAARPPGPGRLLLAGTDRDAMVEIGADGPHPVAAQAGAAPAGPLAAVLQALAGVGIGPGLVLVVGSDFGPGGRDTELLAAHAGRATVVSVGPLPPASPGRIRHVGGGPRALRRLLGEQLQRRSAHRVPAVDLDPGWIVQETGVDPLRHRVTETLFTLGADGLASRGAVEEPAPGAAPMTLAAGVYAGSGPDQHLLPGPCWIRLALDRPPHEDVRTLDLRTGVLHREEVRGAGPPVRTLRFVSLTRPGVVALRAEAAVDRLRAGPALARPADVLAAAPDGRRRDRATWARAGADGRGGLAAAAVQSTHRDGPLRTVERLAAYVADPDRPAEARAADALLRVAARSGFDRLLCEHRAAWAGRWRRVGVDLPDDPAAELALRFALFHLWSAGAARRELAVGARGLSGPGYAGHVFWDADVFVLPALMTVDPEAGAAMVRYRLHRLPAARARAAALGYAGARFPWESAATGEDVTPTSARFGPVVFPVRTGALEEHITADVAWAAVRAAEWAGAEPGPGWAGAPLLVETARYWASRCRTDADGVAHIDGVIGPDEYHEDVDDNAFTNVMARWNLCTAAALAGRIGVGAGEAHAWRDLAEALADGYDPATRRYEQFAGYYGLEPLLISEVAAPPVAADMLLGRERVASSQLIKQPDVLMLHHLVPGEVAAGSLRPNLDYYQPRTAHGSSLSPAVTAGLLARAGRADEALLMLRVALALDLEGRNATTAAGLHMANLGGIWQAMVTGFAGATVRDSALRLDPRLPAAWPRLGLRFFALGSWLRIDVRPDAVEVAVDRPLRVGIGCGPARLVSDRTTFPVPAE